MEEAGEGVSQRVGARRWMQLLSGQMTQSDTMTRKRWVVPRSGGGGRHLGHSCDPLQEGNLREHAKPWSHSKRWRSIRHLGLGGMRWTWISS